MCEGLLRVTRRRDETQLLLSMKLHTVLESYHLPFGCLGDLPPVCYQRLWTARSSNYWTLSGFLSVCFMSHIPIEVKDFSAHLAVYNHIEHRSRGAYLTPGVNCCVSGHWALFTNHWFCCTTEKDTRQGFASSRTILVWRQQTEGGHREVSQPPNYVFVIS